MSKRANFFPVKNVKDHGSEQQLPTTTEPRSDLDSNQVNKKDNQLPRRDGRRVIFPCIHGCDDQNDPSSTNNSISIDNGQHESARNNPRRSIFNRDRTKIAFNTPRSMTLEDFCGQEYLFKQKQAEEELAKEQNLNLKPYHKQATTAQFVSPIRRVVSDIAGSSHRSILKPSFRRRWSSQTELSSKGKIILNPRSDRPLFEMTNSSQLFRKIDRGGSTPSLCSEADDEPQGTMSNTTSATSEMTSSDDGSVGSWRPCNTTALFPHSKNGKVIRFNPQLRVFEFKRCRDEVDRTWFTAVELDRFRRNAITLIQQQRQELVPTGTGRIISRPVPGKLLFTNPVLTEIGNDEDDGLQRTAIAEIKNILVVDPLNIFLKLFAKSLKTMLPHVNVATAQTSQEALRLAQSSKRVSTRGYDLFIIEERLHVGTRGDNKTSLEGMACGSSLIKTLSESNKNSLFIGVTAHMGEDQQTIEASGADLVWSKPPPNMNTTLKKQLLELLQEKRK